MRSIMLNNNHSIVVFKKSVILHRNHTGIICNTKLLMIYVRLHLTDLHYHNAVRSGAIHIYHLLLFIGRYFCYVASRTESTWSLNRSL